MNIGFFPHRAYCANMLATQSFKANGRMLKFRHTANIHKNLEQVKIVMDLANREFVATAEQFQYLATQTINSAEELAKYVKLVFVGENYEELEKDGKRPAQQIINNVFELFQNGRGADLTANTYWKAYNAVNEYICHHRGSDEGKRLNSVSFGEGAVLNRRALEIAINLAA